MATTAPSAESSDDLSIATPQTENRCIANSGEAREYVVKFLFRPTGGNNNTAVAKTHFAILRTILDIYPEVRVFNNFGHQMKDFNKLNSYDAYLRHFKLQFVKANNNKNRTAIYLVFHQLLSSVPLSEIRRHATIDALLHQVHTRMTVHHWTEDDTRISNLGFFVGYDPTNILHDELEERVRQAIVRDTKMNIKMIPKFRCGYTSPFIRTDQGWASTKAYDLQCRQSDAKALLSLLQKAYASDPIFIFHKIRHRQSNLYHASIRRQNSFLAHSCVVPVHGISEDVMFYLSTELYSVRGNLDITQHRLTSTTGRWNIFTNTTSFKAVSQFLVDRLTPLTVAIASEHNFDLTALPEPGLAFQSAPLEEYSSDGSFQLYISACSSSIFSTSSSFVDPDAADDVYEQPPGGTSPAPQAWSTVPPVITAPTTPSAASPVTQDAFDQVLQENARLTRAVGTLTAQVQQLLDLQRSAPTSASPSVPVGSSVTSPSSPLDIDRLVQATTASVLAALRKHHFPPLPSPARPHLRPSTSPRDAESLTRPAKDADMSLDSSPIDSHGS